MKIKKSYLQQIINEELFRHLVKEELLKELMGPPKKPPTKIKPKAKPKPIEKSLTFYYLLNDSSGKSKLHEKNLSAEQIKQLNVTGITGTEDQIYYHTAKELVKIDSSNYIRFGPEIIKEKIIPLIPELASLMSEEYKEGHTYTSYKEPPRITSHMGKKTAWNPELMYNQTKVVERKISDQKFGTLLKYLWIDQFESKRDKEKYTSSTDIQELVDAIKRTEDEEERLKNNKFPYKVEEFRKKINDYKETIKNYSVGDKVVLKKYLYCHGFMPIAIVMTGIVIPSKENEVFDAVGQYYRWDDTVKEYKSDNSFTEFPQAGRQEITSYITGLIGGVNHSSGLNIKSGNIKGRKIDKEAADSEEEQKNVIDDPMSDFNKSIKDILGTTSKQT